MVRRVIEALIWLLVSGCLSLWSLKILSEYRRAISALMAVCAVLGFILILVGKMSFAGILEMWRWEVEFCPWCM